MEIDPIEHAASLYAKFGNEYFWVLIKNSKMKIQSYEVYWDFKPDKVTCIRKKIGTSVKENWLWFFFPFFIFNNQNNKIFLNNKLFYRHLKACKYSKILLFYTEKAPSTRSIIITTVPYRKKINVKLNSALVNLKQSH